MACVHVYLYASTDNALFTILLQTDPFALTLHPFLIYKPKQEMLITAYLLPSGLEGECIQICIWTSSGSILLMVQTKTAVWKNGKLGKRRFANAYLNFVSHA